MQSGILEKFTVELAVFRVVQILESFGVGLAKLVRVQACAIELRQSKMKQEI